MCCKVVNKVLRSTMYEYHFFTPGTFCPTSYPHPYADGTKCCKSAWKSRNDVDANCDGRRLTNEDTCCSTENGMDCKKTDSSISCRANSYYGVLPSFFASYLC